MGILLGAFTAKANGIEHKNPKTDGKDDVVDDAEQNEPQEESGDNENDHEGSADGDRYPPTKRNPAAVAAFRKENVHEDKGTKVNGDRDASGNEEVQPLGLIASIEEEDASPYKP